MNPARESRLVSALSMHETVVRKMLDEADKRARRQRLSSGRIVLDVMMESAKEVQSTVEVLVEIHSQKPSEKRAAEAVAAMRILAQVAATLAAASLAVVVETQVAVSDLSAQPSN